MPRGVYVAGTPLLETRRQRLEEEARSRPRPQLLRRRGLEHHRRWCPRRTPAHRVSSERAVQESATPEFERQHRPELQIEIATARVETEQAFDGSRFQNASFAAPRGQEYIACEVGKLSSEPARERDRKSMFLPIDDRV